MNIVALLDSMWGWRGLNHPGNEAPRYFQINPLNFSGRRLHRICGENSLLVTNCCRTVQSHANAHGKPDPSWVSENLKFLESQGMDVLLVCGNVARATFGLSVGTSSRVRVLFMDHPAARRWTNAALDEMAKTIASIAQEQREAVTA